MPIFYYHPQNEVAKKLAELTNSRGFFYENRGVMEIKLQHLIAEAGYDLYPTFHTMLGSLAGTVEKHLMQTGVALNPDDELDRMTLKLCKSSSSPWSFVKVINGPQMSCCVGYCSTPASSPFAMSATEMAKRGLIPVSHMPSAS